MISFPLFLSNKYTQFKTFFVGPSLEENKIASFDLQQMQPYSYIDANLDINQKIELEKRRRYQAYMSLDYLLSVVTYFDFFSFNTFQIAKKSKDLTQLFEKKVVTSEFLLLPFFEYNLEISTLLEKYGINEKEVSDIICKITKTGEESFSTTSLKSIKNFCINIDIPMISEMLIISKETQYSYEINQIFEKAAENALSRFKTPVVSSEILLITMLEAKKSKVGKLLKQLLKSETNWYTLRYSLMKRLHNQELAIRTDVPKNQQYFAYLLKTQLPELQFDTLIEKDCLLPGVLLFRNNMIADIMKLDIYKRLKSDISSSIKSTTGRNYSIE
jgi:hypothetical protein